MCKTLSLLFINFFGGGAHCIACRILVPQPETELVPPAES